MKAIIHSVMLLSLFCGNAVAVAAMPDRATETLRGLSGVSVVIEPLPAVAKTDGLSQQLIQSAVEQQLHAAGIRVLDSGEWRSTPGAPYLYVNVSVLKKRYGLYAYAIEVCLNQIVTLTRAQNIQEFAETWETREVGTVGKDRLPTLRESVMNHVQIFIRDYFSVNPGPRAQRRLHPRG